MKYRRIIIRLINKREECNRTGYSASYGSDLLGLLVKTKHADNKDERVTLEDIID